MIVAPSPSRKGRVSFGWSSTHPQLVPWVDWWRALGGGTSDGRLLHRYWYVHTYSTVSLQAPDRTNAEPVPCASLSGCVTATETFSTCRSCSSEMFSSSSSSSSTVVGLCLYSSTVRLLAWFTALYVYRYTEIHNVHNIHNTEYVVCTQYTYIHSRPFVYPLKPLFHSHQHHQRTSK
jgi:hypothetical protein